MRYSRAVSARGWGKDGEQPFPTKLPPGPHQLPRELVRANQRRRILLASLDVFGHRGFEAATVKDLLGGAHVSRATFYEVFADKEDCMVALHDELLTWLWEEAAAAVAQAPGWEAEVRLAVARAVKLLSGDPRLAVVCAVEGPVSRIPRVRARHQRLMEDLCQGLRKGREGSSHGEQLPELLETALVCGAIYLIGQKVVRERGVDVDTLAAELTALMLVPYRG